MNIWKPVAIGCIGYIAGMNGLGYRSTTRMYRDYSRNSYSRTSLKDDLMDILVGKFYYLVWGETREQTNDRRLDRRFGHPVSYAPVYQSAGGGGGESDDEDEEN